MDLGTLYYICTIIRIKDTCVLLFKCGSLLYWGHNEKEPNRVYINRLKHLSKSIDILWSIQDYVNSFNPVWSLRRGRPTSSRSKSLNPTMKKEGIQGIQKFINIFNFIFSTKVFRKLVFYKLLNLQLVILLHMISDPSLME